MIRAAIAAVCAALTALPVPVLAQAWPSKPVRLIVPFSTGGTTDIVARLYAQRLTEATGTQFVVDNRAGAGGTIGTEAGARSAPRRPGQRAARPAAACARSGSRRERPRRDAGCRTRCRCAWCAPYHHRKEKGEGGTGRGSQHAIFYLA